MKRLIIATSLLIALGACGNGEPTEPPKPDVSTNPKPTPTQAPVTPTAEPEVKPSTPDTKSQTPTLDFSSFEPPYNTADADKGAKLFRQCVACHRIDETGKHRTGPNLHGVIGRAAGALDTFNYSTAMKESGIVWTAETLDAYLTNPRSNVPGTRMSYAGLRRPDDRVNLIAYLMAKSVQPDTE